MGGHHDQPGESAFLCSGRPRHEPGHMRNGSLPPFSAVRARPLSLLALLTDHLLGPVCF